MNMHTAKKWPEKVVQRSFIKGHSFPIGLYTDFSLDLSYNKETNKARDKELG